MDTWILLPRIDNSYLCAFTCTKNSVAKCWSWPPKVVFHCKASSIDVKTKLESVYPKLIQGGGFKILRSGSPSSKLSLITPPAGDYSVPFLRDSAGVGQALAYIGSLQKDLDTSALQSDWLVPSRLSWERGEARGVMGRRKGERRLADPVFKMVDELMADGAEILNLENRPFHRAYLSRKLPCPHILCRAELGRAFCEETGLVQHVRVKHAGVKCDEKFKREAWRLFRFKHGEETKNHSEWLSTRRLTEVCSFYCYCNSYFSRYFRHF